MGIQKKQMQEITHLLKAACIASNNFEPIKTHLGIFSASTLPVNKLPNLTNYTVFHINVLSELIKKQPIIDAEYCVDSDKNSFLLYKDKPKKIHIPLFILLATESIRETLTQNGNDLIKFDKSIVQLNESIEPNTILARKPARDIEFIRRSHRIINKTLQVNPHIEPSINPIKNAKSHIAMDVSRN